MSIRLKYLRKRESIIDRLRSFKNKLTYNITIIGSYNTMNAGDKILCDAAAHFFLNKGFKVNIQSKRKIIAYKSKFVIVCGGDILHDNSQKNVEWLNKLLILNKKVVFLGAGVPGFYLTTEQDIYKLLNKAYFIITRDKKSFQRLKKINLNNILNGVDNAFLIKDLIKKDLETNKAEVILNIKEYASASLSSKWVEKKGNQPIEKSDYLKFISKIIDYYRSKGDLKISALPMTFEDEIFIRKHFKNKIDFIYKYTSDFHKISSIISKSKEVFTTRFHFHLLSLINNKKIICYAYADKVENINDEIGNFKYISREEVLDFKEKKFDSYVNNFTEYAEGFEKYLIKSKSEIEFLNELK